MTEEPRTELVEARELTDWDERDKFRHQDLADQLADLAVSAPTPANIALYGPWGSGKTGVGNLIKARLKQQEFKDAHPGCEKAEYVWFDAFKYAETPLRRHFLSQVADQLLGEKEAEDFRDRLYHSEVTSRINFEQLKNFRIVAAFVLILALGLFLAGLAAAAAAGIAVWTSGKGDPGFVDRALSYFSSAVGFSFAPAAVLGGLFALAGNTLPVTRTKDSPSSDEQFEAQFHDLLTEAGTERVVVFVDELDRCSPHQVVDVLDTIRTFLDVKGTVFIVAADQNVLERALTERVQQTTPSDPSNPYYSTGSAYLDKVFHYQTSLPPLLPGRITRYAVELVKGRPGLWSDPQIDVEWLISVLIPTHVRSPRRVKTLVNNYVLAYRLAQQRHAAGHLSTPPAARALELAKLVTLRTEFPRFARDLPLSRRLPELLLALADTPVMAKPSGVSDEVWAKAKVFTFGEEDVAVMLTDGDPHEDDDTDDSDDDELDEETTAAERSQHAAADTSAAMLQQLVYYLKKTQHIENPHRDLIFAEAQGNLFDLDESIAEDIEDAAVGARYDELVQTVDELEPGEQTNAVRFLAQQTREAAPGIEGQNLVEGLLAVAGSREPAVIDSCADEAIEAVNIHGNYGNLSGRSLPGALRLAIGTNRDGTDLVHHVIGHDSVLTNAELGNLILEFGDSLVAHADVVGRVAASRLIRAQTARETVRALHSLEHKDAILDKTDVPFGSRLQQASKADTDNPPDDPVEGRVRAAVLAIDAATDEALALEDRTILAFLVRVAYARDDQQYWLVASAHVSNLDDSDEGTLAKEAVLHRTSLMSVEAMREALAAIPDNFAADEHRREMTDQAAERLWSRREELGTGTYRDHDQQFVETLEHLARVSADGSAMERAELVDLIDEQLPEGSAVVPDVPSAAVEWSRLRRFAETGVLASDRVAALIGRRLRDALAYTPSAPQRPVPGDDAQQTILRWIRTVAQEASAAETASLIEAVQDCDWIPDANRQRISLLASADSHRLDPADVVCPFTTAEVQTLAAEHGAVVADAVSAWIDRFAKDADDLTAGLRHLHDHYKKVREGVHRFVEREDSDTLFAAAEREIQTSDEQGRPLNIALLEDLRFDRSDERAAADVLVAEFGRSGSRNPRRRELIEAWKVLGPQNDRVRRTLIEGITLPTLDSGGQEGFRIVFREMGLLADPPDGTKRNLKAALRKAAPAADEKRLEGEMARFRIIRKEKGGFLGLSEREVDED